MSRALGMVAIVMAILTTVEGSKVFGILALLQGLYSVVMAYVEEYHSEKSSHTHMDS